MNKDTNKALIGIAGGVLLLAFKPDVASLVAAGNSVFSLGLELQQLLNKKSPESRRVLERIRKAVSKDFAVWARTEGIQADAELSAAEARLAAQLQVLILQRDRLAAAAFEPDGFVRGATDAVLAELARTDDLFRDRPGNIARQYTTVVVASALRAVFTERAYFEALQPHLTLNLAQTVGEIDRKVARVLALVEDSGATGGLSRAELQALLRAFFEEQVPEAAAHSLLLEKAEELRSLRARLKDIDSADATLQEALSKVDKAIDGGRYGEADTMLSGLIEEGGSSAARALATTVELFARRADLAHAQAKYLSAAMHFGRAAGVAQAFKPILAWRLLGEQAESLIQHALRVPGVEHFERAIGLTRSRFELVPPGSPLQVVAVGQLINMLGLYAQRADNLRARDAIKIGLDVGRKVLRELDPARDAVPIVKIGNSVGALLNRAIAIGITEEQNDLRDEAVEMLTRAAELAPQHAPEDLGGIHTNLATALRKKAEVTSTPRQLLEKAIESRRQAITKTSADDVHDLSNAYESLGNDYRALDAAEETGDRDAFFDALSAYRRALTLRLSGSYPVDAAQCCFNIGGLYMERGVRLEGTERTRLLNRSIRHTERGLRLVSKEGAPALWLRLTHHWVDAKLALIIYGETMDGPDVVSIAETMRSLVDFAHLSGDARVLFDGMYWGAQLSWLICQRRQCSLAKVVADQFVAFEDLLKVYRHTPWGIQLDMWVAETEFIVGDLTDDLQAASRAQQRAMTIADGVVPLLDPDLIADMKEVSQDLTTRLAALAQRVASIPAEPT